MIYEEFKNRGTDVDFLDVMDLICGTEKYEYDLIVSRVERDYLTEGIYALKHFENEEVSVINSSEAIETCQNKYLTYLKLKEYMPKSFLTYTEDFEKIKETLNKNGFEFPVVVKPVYGGYGNGVLKVNNLEELKNIFELLRFNKKEIFIQEYVPYKHDIRAFVVGDSIVGAMEKIPKNDWRANYSLGCDIREFKLNDTIEDMVLKSAEKLGADIVGIDVLIDGNQIYILEANITPQFRGMMNFVNIPKEIVNYCLKQI